MKKSWLTSRYVLLGIQRKHKRTSSTITFSTHMAWEVRLQIQLDWEHLESLNLVKPLSVSEEKRLILFSGLDIWKML